ncbi:MAG TPA: putative toxin-antitoxin system toxin component, PIN family [Thermomicrobiales bacterium]|nr:putative toxin-antitoxin system toxin component, PIN family [Thermomicrobiales bacterium]
MLLDTNVLAAGMAGDLRASTTPPTRIWRHWLEKRFALLISEHVLAELGRTFEDPWFVAQIASSDRDRQFEILTRDAEIVEVAVVVEGVAAHPADDFVLAAAVSGNADYLVTGDVKFRTVDEHRGVKIRTPREFLAELDAALFS